MNFGDLRFWGFLFVGLLTLLLLRAVVGGARADILPQYDKIALLALGMFLLLCVSCLTFLIWLAVALATYAGVWWIMRRKPESPKLYLAVLIPCQLAPLFYYKYSDFVVNGVAGMGISSLRGLIIPAGLSFYTFQKIAFSIDIIYAKERLPKFLDYLNFAGFFPQIVAGPIERKRDLLPQMERFRFAWDGLAFNEGLSWIVVGLFFKCCLADNLAIWTENFIGSTANSYQIWLANLSFGLRIYFDFAGYSLVAVGIARCFGVGLTLNFLSPYCSTSMQEFWRRWHVTLSQWFRDYLYIPMGGGRTRFWAFNILVVFVVSGVWHGAGWNFVFWGLIHGIFLIVNRMARNVSLPATVGWLGTIAVVFLAWLCFYETRSQMLCAKLASLFTPSHYSLRFLGETKLHLTTGQWISFGFVLALAFAALLFEWLSIRNHNEPYKLLRRPVMLGVLVVLIVLLTPDTNNAFIYFAF